MKKVTTALAILAAFPSLSYAHGWSEFPSARQNTCYEEGNLYYGTPKMPGCAKALAESGAYPFVQRNEFSKNVEDYTNIEAVKAAIPDGTLCYANDPQKAGFGAANPPTAWTRTEIQPGPFEFVFKATAKHNPSFWQFYLTKPSADLSKALKWSDLELIQTEGDVPIGADDKYHMTVNIPSDRSGDAILFVRWQRDDAAGEGFYNCSDITINNGHPDNPNVTPDLIQGDAFVPEDFKAPQIGDIVKYDIEEQNNEVSRSFDIAIDASNINDWQRLLASEVNGWYELYKDKAVVIGGWHAAMNHYMFFNNDPSKNFFNSKTAGVHGVMSLVEYDNDKHPLNTSIYELSSSDNIVSAGDKLVIKTEENATIEQLKGTHVTIENNGSTHAIIDTTGITQDEILSFSATSGNKASTFNFEVQAPTIPPIDPNTDYQNLGQLNFESLPDAKGDITVMIVPSAAAISEHDEFTIHVSSDDNVRPYRWLKLLHNEINTHSDKYRFGKYEPNNDSFDYIPSNYQNSLYYIGQNKSVKPVKILISMNGHQFSIMP